MPLTFQEYCFVNLNIANSNAGETGRMLAEFLFSPNLRRCDVLHPIKPDIRFVRSHNTSISCRQGSVSINEEMASAAFVLQRIDVVH